MLPLESNVDRTKDKKAPNATVTPKACNTRTWEKANVPKAITVVKFANIKDDMILL